MDSPPKTLEPVGNGGCGPTGDFAKVHEPLGSFKEFSVKPLLVAFDDHGAIQKIGFDLTSLVAGGGIAEVNAQCGVRQGNEIQINGTCEPGSSGNVFGMDAVCR